MRAIVIGAFDAHVEEMIKIAEVLRLDSLVKLTSVVISLFKPTHIIVDCSYARAIYENQQLVNDLAGATLILVTGKLERLKKLRQAMPQRILCDFKYEDHLAFDQVKAWKAGQIFYVHQRGSKPQRPL